MIIDAQVHLWEANNPKRPWPDGAAAHLPEPMTAERYLAIADQTGVDRAVIAPPFVSGFDPSFALECAARYPQRLAVMGRYDPDDPASIDLLPGWLKQPGMLALRLGLTEPSWSRWRRDGTLDTFWPAAAEYGIPVALFIPPGLDGIETIVSQHPRLNLIIDHCNLPGSAPENRNARIDDLVALAKFPNVSVKVSAMPMYVSEPYPWNELGGYVRRVRDAFGADRMMWGADLTMAIAHKKATYRQSIDLILQTCSSFLSARETDLILGGTLQRLLRWP